MPFIRTESRRIEGFFLPSTKTAKAFVKATGLGVASDRLCYQLTPGNIWPVWPASTEAMRSDCGRYVHYKLNQLTYGMSSSGQGQFELLEFDSSHIPSENFGQILVGDDCADTKVSKAVMDLTLELSDWVRSQGGKVVLSLGGILTVKPDGSLTFSVPEQVRAEIMRIEPSDRPRAAVIVR